LEPGLATGKPKAVLLGLATPVRGRAYSPDGRVLVTGGGDAYQEISQLKIWDVGRAKEIDSLQGQRNAVHAVAISRDGKVLAAVSGDVYQKRAEIKLLGSCRTPADSKLCWPPTLGGVCGFLNGW